MAAIGRAGSVASSAGSFVDASGYKFSEKDTKPGKIKLKKAPKKAKKTEEPPPVPSRDSPILPELDEKTASAFPSGKPREDQLETVLCKHCKRPVLKQTAVEHIRGCLRAKQEKARKKKEARDAANRAKEKADRDVDDDAEADDALLAGQKTAKKGAKKVIGDDSTKKGKKRKADADEDKEPKKKKKKDEPKQKAAKPKGPVDVERQCGVILPNGAQCARSLTCKSHSMGAKRAVPGRSLPYDMLLQAYQKKNQARQQKAAIDANAPIPDELENNGPVDSDEEKDAVMAAIARADPEPLETYQPISTRSKYRHVRVKGMLSQALGGARGGGLFSTGESNPALGRNIFQPAEGNGSLLSEDSQNQDAEGEPDFDVTSLAPVAPAVKVG